MSGQLWRGAKLLNCAVAVVGELHYVMVLPCVACALLMVLGVFAYCIGEGCCLVIGHVCVCLLSCPCLYAEVQADGASASSAGQQAMGSASSCFPASAAPCSWCEGPLQSAPMCLLSVVRLTGACASGAPVPSAHV